MLEKVLEAASKALTLVVIVGGIIALSAIITAFPVKWAWNYVMPHLFGLKEIGFWHAFCLLWLAGSFIKASPKGKE